jgi:hypothetical protein
VVFKRLQEHQDLFSKFYVTSLRIKAVFGPETYEPFAEVRKCFGEVRVAAMMLQRTPYEGYNDREFADKLERSVWNMESDDDEAIEKRIKIAVAKAEANFSKVLKHY